MAAAVSVWRRSSPEAVEADLAALWREVAREGPLSRALMANLVVIRERPDSPPDDDLSAPARVLGDVAQRHPVRAILLEYTRGVSTARAPEAAHVGLLTFGLPASRYGVELIAIHTACAEPSIPSIVRRLSQGSAPTAVWWPGDLSESPPPLLMTTLGRQFLYNSATWRRVREGFRVVAGVIAQPHAPDIADLNWQRLAPLRRAIVHALSSEPQALELRAGDVHIGHGPGRAACAELIGGWLRARLGWSPADMPHFEESAEPPDSLTLRMEGRGWTVTALMDGDRVKVAGTSQPPFEVRRPRQSDADAVAAELRSLGHDSRLQEAVRAAAVLAQ